MSYSARVALGIGLALTSTAHSQEKAKDRRFWNKPTLILFSAAAFTRELDAISTYNNLNNPCRCYAEAGTGFKSGWKEQGYSLGLVATAVGVAWELHRHKHYRLERVEEAYMAYNTYEDATAVVNNIRISGR
jgi:hypothetical protein